MGLGSKLREEKKQKRINTIVASVSNALYKFVKGFPKGAEEKEIAVMLSPGQEDIDIYFVALAEKDKKIEVVRVCTQYKGSTLAAQLFKNIPAGLNISRLIPDQFMMDIQTNDQNNECAGKRE